MNLASARLLLYVVSAFRWTSHAFRDHIGEFTQIQITPGRGNFYALYPAQFTWNDAGLFCHVRHHHSFMVIIRSAKEQQAINYFIGMRDVQNRCRRIWTAGKRRHFRTESEFVWKPYSLTQSAEIPMNYTNWRPEEPNYYYHPYPVGQRESCMLLQYHRSSNGLECDSISWNDERCSQEACVLCEFIPS